MVVATERGNADASETGIEDIRVVCGTGHQSRLSKLRRGRQRDVFGGQGIGQASGGQPIRRALSRRRVGTEEAKREHLASVSASDVRQSRVGRKRREPATRTLLIQQLQQRLLGRSIVFESI